MRGGWALGILLTFLTFTDETLLESIQEHVFQKGGRLRNPLGRPFANNEQEKKRRMEEFISHPSFGTNDISEKVVIASKPRSGSTLLLSLLTYLAPAPSLGIFEPKCGGELQVAGLTAGTLDVTSRLMPVTYFCPVLDCPKHTLFLDLRPSGRTACVDGDGVTSKLASGARSVVTKTITETNNGIEGLLSARLDIKVVVLLRDPRLVLTSLSQTKGFKVNSIPAASVPLCNWMRRYLQAAEREKERVRVVWFEDLTRAPRKTLQKLIQFLGWDCSPSSIDFVIQTFLVPKNESKTKKISRYSLQPRHRKIVELPFQLENLSGSCTNLFQSSNDPFIRVA